MKITEMRSALDEVNAKKGLKPLPETIPDYVIRNMYERKNKLPLTPLPAEVRGKLKSFSELNIIGRSETRAAKAARLMAEIAAEQSATDAENMARLRARYQNLFS